MSKQAQLIRVSSTLHAQLKALAAARGTTMTAVIHDAVRKAIAAGEIPNEMPGLKIEVIFDADAPDIKDMGPFVRITGPEGEFPLMTGDQLALLADTLSNVKLGDALDFEMVTFTKGGPIQIQVGFVGTGVEISGTHRDSGAVSRVVMPVAAAHDFGRVLAETAQSLKTAKHPRTA